jgi:hypothetical protein
MAALLLWALKMKMKGWFGKMLIRATDNNGRYVYFRTLLTSPGCVVQEWTHNPNVANCYEDFQTANEALVFMEDCMMAGKLDMRSELTVVDYKTMEEVWK